MTHIGLILEVLIDGVFLLWLLGLVPAALVSILKGRLLLFATGWLTFGITWFIGALPLADANSAWAQRFYGEQRLARATDPVRNPRPQRETVLWLGGALALVLGVGVFAARPTPITGFGGRDLQYSVDGGHLGSSAQPCEREGDRVWNCYVYDSRLSGSVPYRVKIGGFGCWTAVRTGSAGEGAKRLTGCVTVWDQIRPLDRIL